MPRSLVNIIRSLDITDRVARALGKVGLQVAGSDVAAANPVHVAPGTSATWDIASSATRLIGAITGANGTAIASASNPVPVGPGTSTVWDVSSRAARLLGALTGVDGANVATAANPVPVGLSTADNTLFTGGTQKAILRGGVKGATSAADVTSTASGADHQAADVIVYDASGNVVSLATQTTLASLLASISDGTLRGIIAEKTWTVTTGSTLATAGQQIVSGACVLRALWMFNNTGASVIMYIADRTSTIANGTIPAGSGGGMGCTGTLGTGGPVNGIPTGLALEGGIAFANGVWAQASSTISSMTSQGSTTIYWVCLYRPGNGV